MALGHTNVILYYFDTISALFFRVWCVFGEITLLAKKRCSWCGGLEPVRDFLELSDFECLILVDPYEACLAGKASKLILFLALKLESAQTVVCEVLARIFLDQAVVLNMCRVAGVPSELLRTLFR